MSENETNADDKLPDTVKRLAPMYRETLDEAHAEGVHGGEAWVHSPIDDEVKVRVLVLLGIGEDIEMLLVDRECAVYEAFHDPINERFWSGEEIASYWDGFAEGALKVWDEIKKQVKS